MTGQVNPPRGTGGTFDPATVNSREVIDFIFGTQGSDDTNTLLVADFVLNGDTPAAAGRHRELGARRAVSRGRARA